MEDLQQWGLDFIIALQRIQGPVPDGIFHAITFLANTEFYILLVPFLLWCVEFGFGARLSILYLLSNYVSIDLKTLFQQPRPFDLDPSVNLSLKYGISTAGGYGFPSGHAQSGTVVWGSIAAWARDRRLRVISVVLIALIGFSRVYLGVHFPTDVLAGWAVGASLLVLYLALRPRIEGWLVKLGRNLQLAIAVAAPLTLYLVYPFGETKDDLAALAGTMGGVGVGLVITHWHITYSANGPWSQRSARYVIGMIVLLSLLLGLKEMFPEQGSSLYMAFLALRYALAGLWVSLGAPWLFKRLKLAPVAESHVQGT